MNFYTEDSELVPDSVNRTFDALADTAEYFGFVTIDYLDSLIARRTDAIKAKLEAE